MKSITTNIIALLIVLFSFTKAEAQTPDSIYMTNIKTVRLYQANNQLSFPVLNLNTDEKLELHFDDLDADVKYYYYTYELCNADWTPANVSSFDYLKGYTQSRITNYRFSAITNSRYTHYQLILPEQNSFPFKSGNYLLKVYLNGDTSQLAFTKRLFIVDNKTSVLARMTQPYDPNLFQTHQKIQFTVDVTSLKDFNPGQQLKIVVLQNYRWDIAIKDWLPAFIRGNSLEYNSENKGIFPGGKEWRWLDIRDFRLQSDRVLNAEYNKTNTQVYLHPDMPLDGRPYFFYRDLNGMSTIEASRGINPFWESDYGTVYFSMIPPNSDAYTNKDIYLFGQLTNYAFTDSVRMKFNPYKGLYETHVLLKQGYYDYTYVTVDKNNSSIHLGIDGNSTEAENIYTILIYYKSFIGRYDELVGVASFNSKMDQP